MQPNTAAQMSILIQAKVEPGTVAAVLVSGAPITRRGVERLILFLQETLDTFPEPNLAVVTASDADDPDEEPLPDNEICPPFVR